MAEQRVIIQHSDGRQYSVTEAGFDELGYKAQGFTIVGPDGDAEGEPAKPKRKAASRKAKSRQPKAAAADVPRGTVDDQA